MKAYWLTAWLWAAPAAAEDQGTVEAIDLRAREIHLKNGKVLALEPRLELYRDDAVVGLDQLRPGDVVRASYGPMGSLRSLEVRSPAEMPTPAEGWEAPKPN